MRYAITGGTGFVGGALARRLVRDGHDVVALVRGRGGANSVDPAIRPVQGDLFDDTALNVLCAGVDGLFHVAGWYKLGVRDPSEGVRVNVEGTRNVLAAAIRHRVPRTVYTSTLAVNSDTHGVVVDESYRFSGTHISAYDASKAKAHDIADGLAEAGHPIVIVMPGLVYGPGDTALTGELLRETTAGRRVVVPAGGGVCWGYVDDVVDGHVRAMTRGRVGESYMLAGPPAPLAAGLRELARLAGTRPPITLPAPIVTASALIAGWVGRVVALPPAYSGESLRAAQATYYGSPAKAVAELGWEARGLVTGLRDLLSDSALSSRG